MLIYLRAFRTTSSICRCRRLGQRLNIVKSSSQTSDFQTNSSTSSDKRTDEEYEWQGTYEKPNILDGGLDEDIEENFMSKISESPLMPVLVQAAPFGIVNTGPLSLIILL